MGNFKVDKISVCQLHEKLKDDGLSFMSYVELCSFYKYLCTHKGEKAEMENGRYKPRVTYQQYERIRDILAEYKKPSCVENKDDTIIPT